MEIFVVIWFALFAYVIVTNIARFIENENSPVLTVPATIADMRRKTHHHKNHHSHSYHITFDKEDGQRVELRVKRSEYKGLSIGDKGMLTHQGTRYKGFER